MGRKKDRGWNLERNEWTYVEIQACLDLFGSEESVGGICCEDSSGTFKLVDVVSESAGRDTGRAVHGQELFEGDVIRLENPIPWERKTLIGVIRFGKYTEYRQGPHLGFYLSWIKPEQVFDFISLGTWLDRCYLSDEHPGELWRISVIGSEYEINAGRLEL